MPDDAKIETKALEIYAREGFVLAIYTPEESWRHDREDVRQRYREKARIELLMESV